MKFPRKISRLLTVAIVVRVEARERFAERRFKGVDVAVAGNFSRWATLQDFMDDEFVLDAIDKEIEKTYRKDNFRTNSFEIRFDEPIGWSNTDDLEMYTEEMLERYEPNRRSVGYRVKLDRTDLKAPRTNVVTVTYEFRDEPDYPVAVIHSIYPGENIGVVRGEISKDNAVVFFDYNHPGQQ